MNFRRFGDSFVASESFFFGFACGDFAHFIQHSFVHFINYVRTETPVESELIASDQMQVHYCRLIDRESIADRGFPGFVLLFIAEIIPNFSLMINAPNAILNNESGCTHFPRGSVEHILIQILTTVLLGPSLPNGYLLTTSLQKAVQSRRVRGEQAQPPEVDTSDLNDGSLHLIVRYWTLPQPQVRRTKTRAVVAIKVAWVRAEIKIPQPVPVTLYSRTLDRE
jgi:hypothetical protein